MRLIYPLLPDRSDSGTVRLPRGGDVGAPACFHSEGAFRFSPLTVLSSRQPWRLEVRLHAPLSLFVPVRVVFCPHEPGYLVLHSKI